MRVLLPSFAAENYFETPVPDRPSMKFESSEQVINDRLLRPRDGFAQGGNTCPKMEDFAPGDSVEANAPALAEKRPERRRANPQRPARGPRHADLITSHRP
ncbi:hypothetical protein WI23_06945 [Burkholderia oklahomensis C6786]|nr:hypothetical protein WI23_06945 [Burkholderia oklahomensis C6786]KUY61398.1 hypothetical protein WI23_12095 [Burkholderia oklahomensis C6786]MBI0358350.1 hypothetical protein [Burkholderia oklahomensis]